MSMMLWKKMLVQLCIGITIGCIGILIYTGKWALLPGWLSALFWAIGWRIEIATRDNFEKEANYWKNMWVNSRNIDLDAGFGEPETKPRYVAREELDARKKRIMEFDFTEPKGKENK